MKILKISLIILVFSGLLWATFAWGGNIDVTPNQAPKGIKIWVKRPPKIDENPDLALWIRPKEERVRLESPGEFAKVYYKLFSEAPNKIKVVALEEVKGKLEETELVKVLTSTVEIQKNEGTARLVVVLPEKLTKRKYHFVIQFLCKEKLLSQAEIWLEVPSRYRQFSKIESSRDLDEQVNGITLAHGIRDKKRDWQLTFSYTHRFSSDSEGSRVGISFRKDW